MSLVEPTGAVLYTDGSARPNPGFWGAGVHGYLYVYPDEKNKASKVNAWQMTDKGYILQKDFEVSGAKPVHVLKYLDCFSSSAETGTNNLGEISALSLFFDNFYNIDQKLRKIHILADSKYALNGITNWVFGWIKKGWISSQGKPVENREAWEKAHRHMEEFRGIGELTFDWVRGHNDDYGNVRADYLAALGTNYSTDGHEMVYHKVSEIAKYHKADPELHPLLGLKRVYFNTDPSFNTVGTYYQTGWSGNDHITGKRTPDASFSVLQLNKPDETIEEVMDAQFRTPSDFNSIVYIKLDRVKSADVFPYLKDHGRFALSKDTRNLNLNFLDGKPVTIEVLSGELPYRSIDVLNNLEEILGKFKDEYLVNGQMDESPYMYRVHPLTDHFFERGIKKSGKTETETFTLRKEFKVGILSTTVVVEEPVNGGTKSLHLPIVFQDDIPSRNTLKHLETLSPRVFLITWRESDRLLRYSTVIQTSDALGIWSNHFANQLLL